MKVDLVLDARAELGEGPVWDPEGQRLFWLDILKGRVHVFRPADASCRFLATGQPVGAAVLRASGGLVLGLRDGFAALDLDTGGLEWLAPLRHRERRLNDGKCDPLGRFFCGSMAFDERPGAGALYRLGPDRHLETLLEDVTISNGLDWTGDQRLMYYVDSPTQRIDVFDYDPATGGLSNRRALVRIPEEAGTPDGLTLDAEGHLWVALWGGGALHRYSPEGKLDRVVPMPVPHPTCPTFGGEDLMDLYVTSARKGLREVDRGRYPQAGGLFRLRPGVRGRPPNRFGG